MTDRALTTTTRADADRIGAMVQMVTDSVSSPSTKRNYRRALVDFLTWYRDTGQGQLSKAVVQRYAAHLVEDLGYSASNINQRLTSTDPSHQFLDLTLALNLQAIWAIVFNGRRLQ